MVMIMVTVRDVGLGSVANANLVTECATRLRVRTLAYSYPEYPYRHRRSRLVHHALTDHGPQSARAAFLVAGGDVYTDIRDRLI